MIHPSYVELMRVVNDDVVIGEEPVVNSRYSIVCATAKRARQLIDGSEPMHTNAAVYGKKPLSIAVDELYNRELKILSAEEAAEKQERLTMLKEKNRAVRERRREFEEARRAEADERITLDENGIPVILEEEAGETVDVDNETAAAPDAANDDALAAFTDDFDAVGEREEGSGDEGNIDDDSDEAEFPEDEISTDEADGDK